MLLAVDVGNTLTKFGLFSEGRLVGTFQRETNVRETHDEYKARIDLFLQTHDFLSRIGAVIVSSVVPSLKTLLCLLAKEYLGLTALSVGPGLKTGVPLRFDNPLEVGSDLVCDAVGGTIRYGKRLFIADLGTANKFLLLDGDGAFSGLVIAPGLSISMDALVNRTSALPEVSMIAPRKVIGKNTVDCMNSGLAYGTAFQIEAFASAFEKEAGYPLKRILTGGNAAYVREILTDAFLMDDNLSLYGLEGIYQRNRRG
ncbi:MAG: type III pantothenate kinase [Bacilli bacterium]|jgi:type III pantothenate kinase|nr:type III pantothenate kinase [Bacilli bacterium]